MKKIFLCIFIILMLSNLEAEAQNLLSECKGNNKSISKFSFKHFMMIKKWTNCQGVGLGPKGGKYVGEFYKGKFHGHGVFTKDGRKYIGQYKNHKRHGHGSYEYANGDKYVGQWSKHKYYGEGIYTYFNGGRYIGEWKKKKYNYPDDLTERYGTGTYIYINGDKYIGKWKDGLKHGKGIFIYHTGEIEKGIWKKDKLDKLK